MAGVENKKGCTDLQETQWEDLEDEMGSKYCLNT